MQYFVVNAQDVESGARAVELLHRCADRVLGTAQAVLHGFYAVVHFVRGGHRTVEGVGDGENEVKDGDRQYGRCHGQ